MQDWLYYLKIFKEIVFKKKVRAFLVGGVIRDLYLGRDLNDIDIVVSKRVDEVARYFADEIDASFVILSRDREIYRVVKENLFFDFTRITGGSIKKDLARRDFTINAIACQIEDKIISYISYKRIEKIDLKNSSLWAYLIDPFNGIDDLKSKRLRVTQENIFIEDPIRLWRALRFKVQLAFELDQRTVSLMRASNYLAAVPAEERIREEFTKILKTRNSAQIIRYMESEFEMLSSIIPDIAVMKMTGENQYHQEDAWTHSLLVLKTLEDLILDGGYQKIIDVNKSYLLKLSAILHDIGKTVTKSKKNGKIHYFGHENAGSKMVVPILRDLKYSREEVVFVKNIILYHMRPLLLYIAENLTEKGRYRFFKQAGPLTPFILIHSLADKTAALKINKCENGIEDYQKFIIDMLDRYYKYSYKTRELFLNGKEIKNILHIDEGPRIGKLIDRLTEAQARGLVNNREEALDFLRNISD